MRNRSDLYLCLSAVITALVVAFISGLILQDSPRFTEAISLQLIILLLFLVLTYPSAEQRVPKLSYGAFLLLVPAIYWLGYRIHIEFFFIYTLIWIACAPAHLSRQHGWVALVLINIGWYFLRLFVWNDEFPLAETLLVTTFHAFALLSSLTAKDSAQANEKTQVLNRELLATQHLLSEASKDSERNRIARDLHDLLGHHLTALTINLQVAERMTEGETQEKIQQCHALSKLLLSDVREAVSTLRDLPVLDLRELLSIAIKDVPKLQIELQMEEDVAVDDVHTAQALLRCVQESITNTLKHSNASRAKITVIERAGVLELTYADNGQGCMDLKFGNGLTGMRERLEQVGGELVLESHPQITIRALAPLAR